MSFLVYVFVFSDTQLCLSIAKLKRFVKRVGKDPVVFDGVWLAKDQTLSRLTGSSGA